MDKNLCLYILVRGTDNKQGISNYRVYKMTVEAAVGQGIGSAGLKEQVLS